MTFPRQNCSKNLSRIFPDAILSNRSSNPHHLDNENNEPIRHLNQEDRSIRRPPTIGLWNVAVALVIVALSSLRTVHTLACYETINGKTTIVQNDSWVYCALIPATMHGKELISGSQFGLGPENDLLVAYNTAFGMSVDEYRILTICIYERYDFSRFITIRPNTAMIEFAFRCVCNYDLCNSETTFSAYLSNIKTESFARSDRDTVQTFSHP